MGDWKVDWNIVERHAREILTPLPGTLLYHNLLHAMDVREAAQRLASMENVSPGDRLLLETAALFHDAGYLVSYHDNEKEAVKIVQEHLPSLGFDSFQIQIISRLILATAMPQRPETSLEQVLCDADLDNLGRDDFIIKTELIRKEINTFGEPIGEKNWFIKTLEMVETHQYFTKAATLLRQDGKKKNIRLLKDLLKTRYNRPS
jgi:predicted metal-dependent HD superfamily phosphohydrolase